MMIKDLFQSKHRQLYLLLGAAVGYLLVTVIKSMITSFAVIEFAYLSIVFGLAPAFFFRRVFHFRNVLGWLLAASILGLVLIPFVLLFFGWLRFNWVFEHSVLFLYLCSAAGLLSLLWVAGEELQPFWGLSGLAKSDWFFLLILVAFTAGLSLHNFSEIHISWDTFTFWGLDARYIFEQNQLRDAAFHHNVLIHRYTSFYPLYYAIIYDLYHGVFEQYATWINVYINLLALLLVYWQVLDRSRVHKTIVTAALLLVAYSAAVIVYLFSMYSDVLCAFLLLLYFVVLLADGGQAYERYARRIVLLLLLALSFYFIKSHFLYFTILLTGIWLLYDGRFLLKNFKSLIKQPSLWLALLLPVFLWWLRAGYFAEIGGLHSNERIDSSFLFRFRPDSIAALINYSLSLIKYMIAETPYFLGMWWLSLASLLFVKRVDKRYLFLLVATLLIFLIPVGSYVLRQFSLQSSSLLRYSAIVMYLFPWLIGFVEFREGKVNRLVAALILVIVAGFTFLDTFWPMPLVEQFEFSGGRYESAMQKYQAYAQDVLDRVDPDAKILIADDTPQETVNNMTVPAIFIRYYMMYNSIGAQYQGMPAEELYGYGREHQADYVLLLSYAGSLPGCETVFMPEHDYLVQISDGEPPAGSCPFAAFTIWELGPAVR